MSAQAFVVTPNDCLRPLDAVGERAVKPELNHFDVSLCKDAMLRLPDAADVQIVCRDGTVWITLDGVQRDFVLEAGGRFACAEHRRVVVMALAPSCITVAATTAAAPSGSSRQRNPQRRGLAFEYAR